jgi:hypothetical protein
MPYQSVTTIKATCAHKHDAAHGPTHRAVEASLRLLACFVAATWYHVSSARAVELMRRTPP